MAFDNAYEALAEDLGSVGEAHWAFGTDFSDPLAGVDTTVPANVDGDDLAAYCLMLGDDALVLSHRLQQWVTHAPELEEEVALANIALDLLGQARLLLARAGAADGTGRGEEDYAFFRDAGEFRNLRLAELADADFAAAVVRLLAFASFRLAVLRRLEGSRDPVLAAIAQKGTKEVAYHRDYAARWVVRLGDGTEVSRARAQAAVDALWPRLDELFVPHDVERRLVAGGVAVDPSGVRQEVDAVLDQVLDAATLARPAAPPPAEPGSTGRDGVHTPALDELLTELQGLARAHAGAAW
jgi:ring-1,2-phenylacetyl-CoA epoxidase subunit PaaC